MNLHRLRYFKAAAEFGSLRKAAEALDMSQPSLSRQIQILEHEFKTPLFQRTNKRMSLTRAGILLAERVGVILDEINGVQREIEELLVERRTHIKVGAIQSTCDYLLPGAIRALRNQYPAIQVAVQGSRSSEIVEKVGRRTLDIGIIAAPTTDPRLTVTHLARDPFRLISARGHRYAAMTRLSVQYLAEDPFITFPRGFVIRDSIDAAFATRGIKPRVVVELESIEAIKELVRQGVGVSLLPSTTLLGEKNRQDLVCIATEEDDMVREILAVRHVADPLTGHAAFLQDAIGRAMALVADVRPNPSPMDCSTAQT